MMMLRGVNKVTELETSNMEFLPPLVVTSTDSMGCEASVFYRHLADLLATHWGQECSLTIN